MQTVGQCDVITSDNYGELGMYLEKEETKRKWDQARQFRASNEEKLLADPVCGTEVNELIQSQENKNTKKARPWQQEFSETGEEKDTYAF